MCQRVSLIVSIFAMLSFFASTSFAQTAKRLRIEALEDELATAESQHQESGNRWALIIGIEKYDDPEINTLRYAVDDAVALHELLINPERGRFSPNNIKLLVSGATDQRLQPIKANILHYLNEWLVPNVQENDTVLIFFSGHGAVHDNRKYLLPADTNTFYMPAVAIDNREFIEGIDRLKADKVITLLDSCHSGGVSRSGKGIADVLPDNFYSEFDRAKGYVTLASCRGNEQSFEWPEKEHGVFTYYLLKGLKGEANTHRDQAVTFDEIARYVGTKVSKWAQEYKNGKQNPRMTAEDQSPSNSIALTFDVVTGYEVVLEDFKNKLKLYAGGTGTNRLSFREVSDARKVLSKIITQIKHRNELSENEDAALSLIAELVKGHISVAEYKTYGDRIRDALEEVASTPAPVAQYGTVKIIPTPWAEIYLDGEYIDESPKILKNVQAGTHTLTLVRAGYKEVSKEIEIVPDEPITIREVLKAK